MNIPGKYISTTIKKINNEKDKMFFKFNFDTEKYELVLDSKLKKLKEYEHFNFKFINEESEDNTEIIVFKKNITTDNSLKDYIIVFCVFKGKEFCITDAVDRRINISVIQLINDNCKLIKIKDNKNNKEGAE